MYYPFSNCVGTVVDALRIRRRLFQKLDKLLKLLDGQLLNSLAAMNRKRAESQEPFVSRNDPAPDNRFPLCSSRCGVGLALTAESGKKENSPKRKDERPGGRGKPSGLSAPLPRKRPIDLSCLQLGGVELPAVSPTRVVQG